MADTIKVNFALQPETVENIEKLAEQTHRGKSNVIDWLVADAVNRIEQAHRDSVTIEAVEQTSVITPS